MKSALLLGGALVGSCLTTVSGGFSAASQRPCTCVRACVGLLGRRQPLTDRRVALLFAALGLCRAAVGNAESIVPYAQDQEVEMKVNGHSLSGVPEEYVAVSVCFSPLCRRPNACWLAQLLRVATLAVACRHRQPRVGPTCCC